MSLRADEENTSGFSPEREVAVEAARAAGAYLLTQLGRAQVTRKKDVHDVQLDADLEAERIILTELRARFPRDSYLSEEAGLEKGNSDRTWLVDPLDGSANFQHGNPMFGVAICLSVGDTPAVGIIYLPMLDELYTAVHDAGSLLNGEPIRVSDTDRLEDAVVHVGDFATTGRQEDNQGRVAILSRLANEASRVRMVGSAAADFAFVASGRADGLIMSNAHPWDIEAGSLLLSEAGGKAIHHDGRVAHDIGVYANNAISARLLRLVQSLDRA